MFYTILLNIMVVMFEGRSGRPVSTFLAVALFLPGLSLTVRRMHDSDHSE